jgi:hypothetical protein
VFATGSAIPSPVGILVKRRFRLTTSTRRLKTIVAFIVGLLIATAAWAQIDNTHNIVWLPNSIGTLNGKGYQMGLRHDGVVVWRWYH